MKNYLKFSLLFAVMLLMSSCGNTDDDTPSTFLEKYDNISIEIVTDEIVAGQEYIKIHNNTANPFESWSMETDCYWHEYLTNILVVQNDVDRLVVVADTEVGDITLTFTPVNGSTTTMQFSGYTGVGIANIVNNSVIDGLNVCN